MDNFISNNKTIIAVAGIIGIIILDAVALFNGIDGIVMSASVGSIAAIVAGALGFEIGVKKKN